MVCQAWYVWREGCQVVPRERRVEIGLLLQQRREELGLSQSEVAARVAAKLRRESLDPNYVHRLEAGKIGRPARERIIAIAEVLGLEAKPLLRAYGYPIDDETESAIIPELRAVLASMSTQEQKSVLALIALMPTLRKALCIAGGQNVGKIADSSHSVVATRLPPDVDNDWDIRSRGGGGVRHRVPRPGERPQEGEAP
jgi:transcriptional regulator with XRE-family HTH domain